MRSCISQAVHYLSLATLLNLGTVGAVAPRGAQYQSGVTGDEDPLRPGFHFLPASDWMNDPNAPFYDASTGYFHLYYQFQTPRVWGHAISRNLVDWTILKTAFNYTDSPYTSIPGETPGVYSGSAIRIRSGKSAVKGTKSTSSDEGVGDAVAFSGDIYTWLTVSTPTNDLMLLAYPSNESDPFLRDYAWDEGNPHIYANETNGIPYGRDPTEAWRCGPEDEYRWCLAYATQESEGCPCSGSSSVVVFSSQLAEGERGGGGRDGDGDPRPQWGGWRFEGTLLNDTNKAVMWECPDFFPLNVSSAGTSEDHAVVWVMKYSIGPGPSYEIPWGIPQPTDYYTTGTYDSSSFTGYDVNKYIYDEAMLRSKAVVLDNGAFYASKTFLFERSGDECSEAVCGERLLWGWVPEERPVDGRGQPFGWAGVMALPRTVRAYQKASAQAPSDPWYLQTQVVESVMTELRIDSSYTALESFTLNGSNSGHGHMQLDGVTGSQLDVQLKLDVKSMSIGSQCGLRVLSAFDGSEYTVVGLHLPHDDTSEGLVRAFVDTSHSCSDASAEVNRTSAFSASMALRDAAAEPSASVVNMRVIVDRSVIELFFADGKQVITRRVYPNSPDSSIQVFAFVSCEDDLNCECSFERVDAWRLRHANITTLDDNADDSPPPSDDEGGSDGNDQDEDTLSEIIGIPSWAAVSVIVVLGVCLVVGIVKFRDHYKRAQDDYRVDRPAAQDDANADYMQPLMVSA